MEPFHETNKLKFLELPSISRQIADNASRPKNKSCNGSRIFAHRPAQLIHASLELRKVALLPLTTTGIPRIPRGLSVSKNRVKDWTMGQKDRGTPTASSTIDTF